MKGRKLAFYGSVALVAIVAPVAVKWIAVKGKIVGLQRLMDYTSAPTQA